MSGREKESERAESDGLNWQRLGVVRVEGKKNWAGCRLLWHHHIRASILN
jgi:hypothetical protein